MSQNKNLNSSILLGEWSGLIRDVIKLCFLDFVDLGHPKIIHRDIKASNILLDESFEAKVRSYDFKIIMLSDSLVFLSFSNWTVSNLQVADFGLAKLSQDNVTHVSTRIMGTFG